MSLLLALALLVHGFIHIGYACVPISFAATGPQFVTGAVAGSTIDTVGNALIVVTALGFLLAALATAGVVVPRAWWRPLVVIASIASATVLAFSPSAWTVPGLVIDAALVVAAIGLRWQPTPFFGGDRRAAGAQRADGAVRS